VANVRELRAISHSDRSSDQVDAEKLARFARLDPKILRLNRPPTADTMQAKAYAAKRFRSNGDVRSQTEPGPCRCTTSPMPTSGPDLFPRSARLGGQTEDLGTGPARHPRHYDSFDALDIGTLRPEFGGRCGGNAVQRSVF
jgi:hypothetical protein